MNNECKLNDSTLDFDVEFKKSKNDLIVPIVNGVHLHSTYNPIREAQKLIENHNESVEKNARHLVFGLGFGYHVQQLAEDVAFCHGDPSIVVIEPNKKVYETFLTNGKTLPDFVKIYTAQDIPALFKNSHLLNFLIQRPALLAHPASFSLYTAYFKEFMNFKASNKVEHVVAEVDEKRFEGTFEKFNKENDFYDELLKYKSNTKEINKNDFLLFALEKIGSKRGETL